MRYATGIPKSEYKKEITAIFYSNTRRGFADWGQCGDLCMGICNFLESAAEFVATYPRRTALLDEHRPFL